MANAYEIEVYSQPNLYNAKSRSIHIHFSEPEQGVDDSTGLLLLIAGYGGEANSNVFCKMRNQFADQYNLVTVQCNYFGWEFMQTSHDVQLTPDILKEYLAPEDIDKLFEDYEANKGMLSGKTIAYDAGLGETKDNFNEMGPMQAMDQLVALKVVTDILWQNGYTYNRHRVIAYGQSHGAYLAYLCNALMPKVFTCIIDNSSYLFPEYMFQKRGVMLKQDGYYVRKDICYLAAEITDDREIYDLNRLYSHIENQARVISFHGTADEMISLKDKRDFLKMVSNAELEVIDEARVDHVIFNHNGHILGADFLKLFDYTVEKYGLESDKTGGVFEAHQLETGTYVYHIDIMEELPILYCILKK